MQGKALYTFIARCVWLVIGLVFWIIALVWVTNNDLNDGWWFYAGLMCLVPMGWPVIKFLYRATAGAAAVGRSRWDVDITSSGNFYVHNHAFGYGLITLLIVSALTVLAGLFILPIYWLYMLYATIMIPVRIHQGYGD